MAAGDRPAATEMGCAEAQPLLREAVRGGLDGEARARVEAHLVTCGDCRALADEERALDRLLEDKLPRYAAPLALRRRLQARLPGVVPTAAAGEARAPRARRARALARWIAPLAVAAAAAVVLTIGLRRGTGTGETLVAEAVADHLRVVYRERPVDIESGGPHQVKPWFTGRLDFALPSVFGGDEQFTLSGGAVGYFRDRQAAVLVYKRRLHTVSLLVFRGDGLSFPRGEHELGKARAALRHERGFSIVLWEEGGLGYALVSDLNSDELLTLAGHVAAGG
jgi:anti-sigma factor RsiW